MNKVILIGRLTKDPELKTLASGVSNVAFSIAVQRNFTNQNGEKEVDFINCVAWRRQAENLAKYCSKGTQVAVEGRMQVRNYDAQDGTKRYVTEVICDNVTFLGSKNDKQSNFGVDQNSDIPAAADQDIQTTDVTEDPFKDFGEEVVLSDDDLPF
ncbi:MAG TPA: single-stranded DNA-binding protein [Bacilli bacterium]|nr:single-stranded DNA-binding protein [Bacilli bacterium]